MRGQTTLTSILPSSVTSDSQRKGQRNVLIYQRDEALAYRYYYYAEIKRLRFDDCLLKLEKEFFITANVVSRRLVNQTDVVKKLVAQKARATYFKKKYPHFSWI
ncbi:MAG: hypothetical protein K2Q03_03440 [Sphingobacteriaceae bacterium]|nr:hypothetical protein [Sphingobacteriaceae bacterium]